LQFFDERTKDQKQMKTSKNNKWMKERGGGKGIGWERKAVPAN
jgi:hypothetical protein